MRETLRIRAEHEAVVTWNDPETGQAIRVRDAGTGDPEPLHGIYTVPYYQVLPTGETLLAFSTYLPDRDVPGSAAEERHEAYLDDLLGSIGKQ